MKKYIVTCVIFLLSVFSLLYFNYMEESNDYYNKMIHIGEGQESTNIVVSMGSFKQDTVYQLFKTYLDKYKGNVFCPVVTHESGKEIYTKYVYFSNIEFLEGIQLDQGRFFTSSENESDKFISTLNTRESLQIGKIANFSGKRHFEIRTIKSCRVNDVFERILTVSFENVEDTDRFIDDLRAEGLEIQKKFGVSALEVEQFNPVTAVVIVSFILLMLLIYYQLLNDYKKIAIEKMLGFRKFSIWFKRILPIAVIEISAMLIASVIMLIVNFNTSPQLLLSFLAKVYALFVIMFIASVIFLSTPFIYIRKIKILNMLKNKKPIKEVIWLNTLVKTGLIVLFLVLAANQYIQLRVIVSTYSSSYANWERTKDYAIIPSVQNKNISDYDPYSTPEMEKNKKLYFTFNKRGAILANFYDFLPEVVKLNKAHITKSYILETAKVNPNYLKMHPILDENGTRVLIDEGETSYILLVPEKYRSEEKEVLAYYQDIASPSEQVSGHEHERGDVEEEGAHTEQGEDMEREVRIIWIKDGQDFFTYNLEINPNQGNCVKDPVVFVLTESNGHLSDYNIVAGYMSNPLKIKVAHPEDPTPEIIGQFKKYYDLSQFNFPVKIIYDIVKAEIKLVQRQILYMSLVMLVLLIMIVVIVFHNIANYYEQNRLKLAIQRFHGYKTFDKFKGYLFGLYISWAVILPISLAIYGKLIMLVTVLLLVLLEIGASFVIFFIVEKQKILKVTKGG